MLRKLSFIVIGLTLLIPLSAYTQKEDEQSKALSICSNCTFTYTADTLTFLDSARQTSTHEFKFNSSGYQVKEIDFNVDVNAVVWYSVCDSLDIFVDSVYVPYDSLVDSIVVPGGFSGKHIYYKLFLTNPTSFDGGTVLTIGVRYCECTPYLPYDTGLALVLTHSAGSRNGFYDEDLYPFYEIPDNPSHLIVGHRTYREPYVKLGVEPVPHPIGDVVDSTYVGGAAEVPVYCDDINFYYGDGYELTVKFDPELSYQYYDATNYSMMPVETIIDDTTLKFSLAPFSGIAPIDSLQVTFLTMHFNVETTASPDELFKVRLDGNYIFRGCGYYADTNANSPSEAVYIKTVKQLVSLKLDTVSVSRGTQDYPYKFYMNNSAPIATDAGNDTINAQFAFDRHWLDNTEWKGVAGEYPYGSGHLRWMSSPFIDTVKIAEAPNNLSAMIEASPGVFDDVGYLTIDAESYGVDIYKFVDRTVPVFNYFVIKHTNDTLRCDSIRNGRGYGDLSLLEGKVTVPGEGGGCPTLYTWHGSGYVLENPILTHSQGKRAPQPADDFYPLTFGIAEDDGSYKLEIRENEQEISFIDQVELIVVDHPVESKVGIATDGQVFTYQRTIEPLAAVDQSGEDLMPLIGRLDDVWLDVDQAGSMIVTYPNPFYGSASYSFALSDVPGPPPPKKKITPENTDGQGDNVVAEIEDVRGAWHSLGEIPPREFYTENSAWRFESGAAELGETFRVRLSWKTGYKSDFQGLDLTDDSYFLAQRLAPAAAEHSVVGKVVGPLAYSDNDVMTLRPGEKIELKFAVPAGTGLKGYDRKFFLHSHGFYKTLTPDNALPTHFALGHNYPNPFNPTTTISFSVPVASEISLVIYNVLGEEVKSLYRGKIEAGNHQLVWGGDNNAGASVASGVYFYRLRAGSFEQTRKMTLVK
ncbi:MAG TPA: FlgD immunoglobulin-like domain containing protein [Candidatus Deferrimicrobium sp.]|nr:FlgD immunoglobulin-like domain containing protein [Candidatus Deferrimicrobium sp.]